MSRSNPYKRKRRASKKTMLVYGEGQSDEIFLKHLRKQFSQNSGVSLTIKRGNGGTPEAIIQAIIKCPGSFDKRIVVIDNDKSKKEMALARTLAETYGISLIENTPCLEATLLSILIQNQDFSSKSSPWCKNEFERKYIGQKQRVDGHRYEVLFTKNLLMAKRRCVPELDQMINIMEGKV